MRRRYEVGCGAVLVLGMLTTAFLLLQVGALDGWGEQLEVSVLLEDAAGLDAGSSVAMAGVEVGRIGSLELRQGRALATLALDPDLDLRTDARVRIRARSVLGEKYLQLEPGLAAERVQAGARLEAAPPPVEIDQLVTALGPLVDAVDPATLSEVFASIDRLLEEDPDVLARMLTNLDAALSDGAALARDSRLAVGEARATLRRVDRAVERLDARGAELEPLIQQADALVGDLGEAARPLPGTVQKADAVLDELQAALAPLREAGVDLSAVLSRLESVDEAAVRRVLREEGVRVRLFGGRDR